MPAAGDRRPLVAALVAALVLVAVVVLVPAAEPATGLPPNVILVVTDDQPADTLLGDPPAMPWLRSQLDDPSTGWRSYTNAVVSTPVCCPSRATLLTGLPSWQTGVTDNETGGSLDEDRTLAVWLHDAGYRTAMIGKYLNGYPWDRGPYVPPGWDRWLAKTNDSIGTTYYGYGLIDQGVPRRVGEAPADYVTDVLGTAALEFVRAAPADQPWFLYLAPPAPHAPYTPAPRHDGAFAGVEPPAPSEAVANDVDGKPAWLRTSPPIDAARLSGLQAERLSQRETLLAVDEYLLALRDVVASRGETERTVIVVTSDNGFAFGDHRWVGKQVPYEPSIRVPLAISVPGSEGDPSDELASNLDIAPTLAALAGVTPPFRFAGRDLTGPSPAGVLEPWVPLGWAGGPNVPAWRGVRTKDRVYIRWITGEEEVYDLRRDPGQLVNLAGEPGAVHGYRRLLRSGVFRRQG